MPGFNVKDSTLDLSVLSTQYSWEPTTDLVENGKYKIAALELWSLDGINEILEEKKIPKLRRKPEPCPRPAQFNYN